MPSSLLSLPDELLAHIVDQALDEYAPRLYKERQATARALSLVNSRIGAIAQPRLVEVVHVGYQGGQGSSLSVGSLPVNGVRNLHVSHPPTFHGPSLERVLAPLSLTDFDALRDLRLVHVSDVPLEQFSRLNELRVLVLDHVTFNADAPFTAHALERLTFSDCEERVDFEQPELLACAGLPVLRHLYLLRLPQRTRRRQLVAPGLLHQVETLGFDYLDDMVRSGSWAALGLDAASLDKTLFDCASGRVDFFAQPVAGPRHLRLYDFYRSDQYSVVTRQYADLARHLAAGNLPDLKTLYLSGTLDVSHGMLPRKLADTIRPVLAQCVTASVAVVFEDGFVTRVANGEERFSPHFEARCQRVRAEKKAARVPELP